MNRAPPGRTLAYIGVGANLGDARATVEQACLALTQLAGTRSSRRSALYRSTPVDASGPDFVNAVVALETTLAPEELHAALRVIEQRLGRVRGGRNAPRTIDLDLLLFGTQRIQTTQLTVPHPRMHQRAFVLVPLAELAPRLVIPGYGALGELIRRCANQSIEVLGDSP